MRILNNKMIESIIHRIKDRLSINPLEKVFIKKIEKSVAEYKNSYSNQNQESKKSPIFFVESIGVTLWHCFVQGLFAKAGEFEGLIPVVIMTRFVRKHRDTLLKLGLKNVELKFLHINILDMIKGYIWAYKEYKNIKSPDDLLNLSFKGIKVGELIYSSYLFNYMTGTIQNITPELRKYLRTCYFHYVYYEKLYKKYNPKFIFATNSTYIPCGILFQLAIQKNIPAYVAVWPTSNQVSVKRFDKNNNLEDLCVANPTTKEWGLIEQNRKKEWLEEGKSWMEKRFKGGDSSFGGADTALGKPWISKEEVLKILDINIKKKVVLVCSHVMWDDPILYISLYRDYYWWWVETAKIVNDIEDTVWIFKAHPGEMDTIGRKTDQTPICSLDVLKGMNLKPHIKFLDSGLKFNNYSLMQIIDAVVTVRGTIGLEYSCIGIPVITAGTGPYSCADFTITCRSIEDYIYHLKNISKLEKLSRDKIERALIFAYFYLAGCSSSRVKGTPDNFDIKNLKDDFMKEFLSDKNWSQMLKNMIADKDCRKIYE